MTRLASVYLKPDLRSVRDLSSYKTINCQWICFMFLKEFQRPIAGSTTQLHKHLKSICVLTLRNDKNAKYFVVVNEMTESCVRLLCVSVWRRLTCGLALRCSQQAYSKHLNVGQWRSSALSFKAVADSALDFNFNLVPMISCQWLSINFLSLNLRFECLFGSLLTASDDPKIRSKIVFSYSWNCYSTFYYIVLDKPDCFLGRVSFHRQIS